MEAGIIQLAQIMGGLGGSLLIVWYVTQKQVEKTVKAVTDQNKEQIEAINKNYDRMLELHRDSANKNFDLLKELIETTRLQSGQLAHLETLVKSNQFCPMQRKGGI